MKRLLLVGTLLFVAISPGETAMAKKIDKETLANKIKALAGLDAEERSELLGLLSEQKKYGLVWEDKPEDVETVMREELPVLAEVKERAIVGGHSHAEAQRRREERDVPNHILIEGDNLHALTCLTYTHSNKIDVIYIDPPYNTGNKDFVYNDRFVDKEDAFRHSKWLSFMAKRLRIAKGLLSDRGVIFISIDDNEQAQLKLLCDEIFGEENFLNVITVRRRIKSLNIQFSSNGLSSFNVGCEYILAYSKSRKFRFKALRTEKDAKKKSDKGKWQGFWSNADRPTMRYEILGFTPTSGQWRNKKEVADIAVENYRQYQLVQDQYESLEDYAEKTGIRDFIRRDPNGKGKNGGVYHWEAPDNTTMRTSSWMDIEVSQIQKVFDDLPFDNPKSVRLIEEIIKSPFETPVTVLDFFAGSGTTLHAVMKLNAEDGGKRTCILVTNNENGICENVTYERNRRVIQGYTNAKGETVPGLTENSLRYYKTEFVPRRPSPRNARELMAASVDLLCVKNDLYEEVPRFFGRKLKKSAGRYFDDGHGKRMLVLFDETTVPSVAAAIREASFVGKVKIYVFAHGDYAYNEEFEEVADKVELCALPAAIRNAYRRVIGKYRAIEEDAK